MEWVPGEDSGAWRGHAPFLLAAVLMFGALPQWEAARRETLLQTLGWSWSTFTYTGSPTGEELLSRSALQGLRLWGMVDWLQRSLKRGAPSDSPRAWTSRYAARCFRPNLLCPILSLRRFVSVSSWVWFCLGMDIDTVWGSWMGKGHRVTRVHPYKSGTQICRRSSFHARHAPV